MVVSGLRCAPPDLYRYTSSMLIMAKIIRWDTPFTDRLFPSVRLLIMTEREGADILKAVVAPEGTDHYPKYLVDFGEFIAYMCMEEAWCPERNFDSTMLEENNLSAYQYLDSPWLRSYERGRGFIDRGPSAPFLHYLIFGGDFNVEVITSAVPTIEVVEQKGVLRIEYEV